MANPWLVSFVLSFYSWIKRKKTFLPLEQRESFVLLMQVQTVRIPCVFWLKSWWKRKDLFRFTLVVGFETFLWFFKQFFMLGLGFWIGPFELAMYSLLSGYTMILSEMRWSLIVTWVLLEDLDRFFWFLALNLFWYAGIASLLFSDSNLVILFAFSSSLNRFGTLNLFPSSSQFSILWSRLSLLLLAVNSR